MGLGSWVKELDVYVTISFTKKGPVKCTEIMKTLFALKKEYIRTKRNTCT